MKKFSIIAVIYANFILISKWVVVLLSVLAFHLRPARPPLPLQQRLFRLIEFLIRDIVIAVFNNFVMFTY